MSFVIEKMDDDGNIPWELLFEADPSEEMVRSYIKRSEVFTAKSGEEICGVLAVMEIKPATWELMNVAVKEGWKNKGIGKQLVKKAIDVAKNRGAATLELGTGNSSIGQLALYQKCGFRITGIDSGFFQRRYKEPIVENGIQCVDMVRLALHFEREQED
ncbi:GNAT family N-acetyltransferase [Bacillus marinisedimentorum]|uniref:GNAT family N-acetyltransferase n=1 Tax=Bacillus marinisedimentorum TaxID=1821260 RepID=UPI0007E0419B|nr:GNAT family N-acetyltransferase [Bacillus marinisedimentorum]